MEDYKKTYVRYFAAKDYSNGKIKLDENGNPSYDPKLGFDRECRLTESDVAELCGFKKDKDGNDVPSKVTPDGKIYVLKEEPKAKAKDKKTEEIDESLNDLELMTDDELKSKAKGLGIKGYHVMGREKLIDSIKEK